MAVWVDQRARSPNRVAYHPAVGRHVSDGIRDAATAVQHRNVLIGRLLVPEAADARKPQVTQKKAANCWLLVQGEKGGRAEPNPSERTDGAQAGVLLPQQCRDRSVGYVERWGDTAG